MSDLRYKVTKLRHQSEWEFRVCAENAAGAGSFSESSQLMKVQDPLFPPAAPTNFKVVDTTRLSVSLEWNMPLYDGGSEIVGYVLEMAECVPDQDEEWKVYVKLYLNCKIHFKKFILRIFSVHQSNLIKSREFTVTGLKEGHEYMFRVFSANSMARSDTPAKVIWL